MKAHRRGEALRNSVRISMNETPYHSESFSHGDRRASYPRKLPFFFWLALPDANGTGLIAFANGFLE
jgi:hypothetical protein